jgi:hypothetical protein
MIVPRQGSDGRRGGNAAQARGQPEASARSAPVRSGLYRVRVVVTDGTLHQTFSRSLRL